MTFVPSIVVSLPALPRTPQGKVDRAALPEPDWSRGMATGPAMAPRTPLESEVAALWAEALRLPEVGVTDAFLDLGGNSLVAAGLAERVAARFDLGLTVAELLAARTVQEMALCVAAALAERRGLPGPASAGESDCRPT